MKKLFLLLLSGGIMMTACKKEDVKKENVKTNSYVNVLKGLPQNPKPASNGKKFYQDKGDCFAPPEACAPYDIVVTPTGTTIKCYMNFVNAIAASSEHEFFADKEQVKALLPFLLDEEWKEFYELTLNPELKFIEQFNERSGKYFYFLVPDNLEPKEFEPGMEYLDLVVELNK
ncbi:MAG: hypothetical protein HPY79_07425 [Bacteroidales bacterium]|nr:hypothetical protein [Bacteroidales bacterium]